LELFGISEVQQQQTMSLFVAVCVCVPVNVCFAGICCTSKERDLSNMPESNHRAKPDTDETRFRHRVQRTHAHPAAVALKHI